MSQHFGNMIAQGGQQQQPQQQQPQQDPEDLQRLQTLLKITQTLKILKAGGPEADALIQQKISEGQMPPNIEQLMAQMQTGAQI